ncbi:hypothetical protein [Enterobacter hormaechei]|uniref:hypothetical protein n=1 Tax=Enterobacter hormaechei TaxID=158836 RepID=UPI0032DA8FF7
MTIRKSVILICGLLLCSIGYADTTAFGITLGKTTIDEFKRAYPNAMLKGTNQWIKGDMYLVSAGDLDFDGVIEKKIIFSHEGKASTIIIDMNRDRFDDVQDMLAKKYKAVYKEIPYVGDKYVRYANGDDRIELDSPHLSFSMQLMYTDKLMQDSFKKGNAEEIKQKKEKETELL